MIIQIVPIAVGRRKRDIPATFFPCTNAEAAARDTAWIVAGGINARLAVPQNTWKWVRFTLDKYISAKNNGDQHEFYQGY